MLNHPTVDKLHQLRLSGMARALASQAQIPDIGQLSFEERLGLLVDSEAADRESRQNGARLKRAKLKQAATPEMCIRDSLEPEPAGLDWQPCTHLRAPQRLYGSAGSGQPEERRHHPLLLRTRTQPDVPGRCV